MSLRVFRRADCCPRIGEPERACRAASAIADIAAEIEPGPVIDGIGECSRGANDENGNRECQPLHGNATKKGLRETGTDYRILARAMLWLRVLLVAGATHGDAAQAITSDLARGAEREVE